MLTSLFSLIIATGFRAKARYSSAFLNFDAFRRKVRWRNTLFLIINLLAINHVSAQDVLLGLTAADGPEGGGTAFSINSNGTNFTVEHTFGNSGHSPQGDLVKGKDGRYYGMMTAGGITGNGTIFKIDVNGKITVIRYLLPEDGTQPEGSLILGNDGNFYGMAARGGSKNRGTIFKITPAGELTVLRNLESTNDGAYPRGSLLLAKDGNFYGMTKMGGAFMQGTVFKITPAGRYTVLKNLENSTTGGYPSGNLVQGNDGNLYGMTSFGNGAGKLGSIFKMSTSGTFSILHHFNYTEGYAPQGSLITGKDGNLYGMTALGGNNSGSIFKISLAGSFSIIKYFDYSNTGGEPNGSLTMGDDGNFYGMTSSGGNYGYGEGTVFKVTPAGEYTVLYAFKGLPDGGHPYGSLVKNKDGYFYGMTRQGDDNLTGYGSVFKISSSGSFKVLALLPDNSKETHPQEKLIQAKEGFYYGTTRTGGLYGDGAVFKLCANGSYQTVFSFKRETTGASPSSSLIQDKEGNFYGTTGTGGQNDWGTIYKITQSGQLTILYHFDTTVTGYHPGDLVQASDNNLYGMTNFGGVKGYGTIFKITPAGTFTIIRNLEIFDGIYPEGKLIQGKDGYLYGMALRGGNHDYGTIFKVSLTGTFTVMQHLSKDYIGGKPSGNLMQAADGNFYGMTSYGGKNYQGTIFKMTPSGAFTVLHNFNFASTGFNPMGGLIQGSDGTFYGLNLRGGKFSGGTIFKMTPSGDLTVLRHLNPALDGNAPMGSLIIQKANPVAYGQNLAAVANTTKAITLKGTGGSPLVYNIVSLPQNGTLTGSGAKRTYTPKAGFTGQDSFVFTVTWGCLISAPQTVFIEVSPAVASSIKINAGGGALSTTQGTFTADTYYSGATMVSTTTSSIANTTEDALYQDNRRATTTGGSFSYSIPVVNGLYTVRLHFTEIFFTALGKRQFNVTAEGSIWLTNYDIYAEAGGMRSAVVATKTINITDGILQLNFTSTVDKACVSAIEVVPVAGAERLAQEVLTETESSIILDLYPNPVHNQFTVQLSQPLDNPQTSVRDAAGAEVLHNPHQVINSNQLQVNVEALKPGLYLFQVQSNEGFQTIKFLKE